MKLTLTGQEFCSLCKLTFSRLESSAFNFQQPMNFCCDMIDRYTEDDLSRAAAAGADCAGAGDDAISVSPLGELLLGMLMLSKSENAQPD